MKTEYEVVLVGAGVVGLTSALAMATRGFKVALLDDSSISSTKNQLGQSPESNQLTPRAYAINKASEFLLHTLGVWQHIEPSRIAPYRKMHVWDAQTKHYIDFDSKIIHENNLGHILEERVLKQALHKEITQTPNIHLFPHHRVTGIQNQKNKLQIVTNTTENLVAKLLMIADGPNSFCRTLLKVPLTSWPYHQDALVALIQTEKSHEQTAFQVFTSDGTLAFLPLAHPNYCSIVWSTTSAKAKELQKLPDDQFNQILAKAFEYRLGTVKLKTDITRFPLIMRHAKQYKGNNWLLLGDAAHTVHPLAGLGLNLGLADISSWLTCLKLSNNLFTLKALASYQRERKHAIWQVIAMMEGLKTLFLNPMSPIAHFRGLGISICNRITPLKKQFIKYASGV